MAWSGALGLADKMHTWLAWSGALSLADKMHTDAVHFFEVACHKCRAEQQCGYEMLSSVAWHGFSTLEILCSCECDGWVS